MSRFLTRSFVGRLAAVVLTASQVSLGVPVAAQTPKPTSSTPATPVQTARPPAPKVTVNRTVPHVMPPPSEPQFSATPTVEEIFRARVFEEPLVPVGGEPSAAENKALADALLAFHRRGNLQWFVPFSEFLAAYPESPWRASLLANLGTLHRQLGANFRALEAWHQAWTLARSATDPHGRAVADYAIGEWASLAASFGQVDEVSRQLDELRGRAMSGTGAVKVAQARETIGLIRQHPDEVVASGPQALLAILSEPAGQVASTAPKPAALVNYRPTLAGTSLAELESLARGSGLRMRAAFRKGADVIPVPSVVHWKVGHYSAVVEQAGNNYRIVDQGLNGTYWASRDTLLDETSGYFLIRDDAWNKGWQQVDSTTAGSVVGHSCPSGGPGPNPCPGDPPCKCKGSASAPPPPPSPPGGGGPGPCGGPSCNMPSYEFSGVAASLLLFDTPLGYVPPRGPSVPFTVRYFQREIFEPQIFTYANLGPKWTFGWLRFVKEEPQGMTPAYVWLPLPQGGRDVYKDPDPYGVYPAHWRTRATLAKVSESPVRYELHFPDGRVEIYGQSDGAPSGERRIFLTEMIDARSQSLALTWDTESRLVAITDALGQVTTLEYSDAEDPLKITAVEDPFGRRATFNYNSAGQLASITDTIGLTSSFGYGPADFVNTLTTPYGTTSFRHEPDEFNNLNFRFIEATDPLGGTEHLEFQWETPELDATAPANEVPTGFDAWNTNLDHWNTFYWDKRAWSTGAGDLSKARVTHWLIKGEWLGATAYSVGIPHSVKEPLEGRIWHSYPGQTTGTENALGSWREPSRVGRVLDDGSSQVYETTYNDQGSVLTRADPLGRQTTYTYGANGVDLVTVRQTTGGMNELLATYADFNTVHQPRTATDASGQATTTTYNTAGQPLTVTNARDETTTYAYDADGRLTSVTGPVAGATTAYAYDGYGRIRTITNADDYAVTTDLRHSRPAYPGHLSGRDIPGNRLRQARRRAHTGPPRAVDVLDL